MRIEIKIQAEQLEESIAILKKAIEHPELLLENVAETLMNINQRRHKQELDPEGKPWQPLSPITLAAIAKANQKKKHKPKGKRKILHNRGDMLGSLTYKVEGEVLSIGFSNKLAKYHHFGTSKKGRHPGLPARPLLGVPDSDKIAIKKTVAGHLETLMRRKK